MKKYISIHLLFWAVAIVMMAWLPSYSLDKVAQAEDYHLSIPNNDYHLSRLNYDVRLHRDAACFLSDGSVVLAGLDSRYTFNDESIPAVMVCMAVDGIESQINWKYEICKGLNSYSAFCDVQALPDNSVLALLTVSVVNAQTQKIEESKYIHIVRDGVLIDEYPLDDSVYSIMVATNGILVQSSDYTTMSRRLLKLTYYDFNGNIIWQQVYDEPINIAGCIISEDIIYIVGRYMQPDEVFYQYIAKLGQNGELAWLRKGDASNSTYSDAILGEGGDIIAVGGVYEASDGSEWPKADIVCYTSSGEVKWKRQTLFDEGRLMWSAVQYVNNGFVVAGRDADSNTWIAHYTFDGQLIFLWDEPHLEVPTILESVDIISKEEGNLYLVLTGDTGWQLTRQSVEKGMPRYVTVIKHLSYWSPL